MFFGIFELLCICMFPYKFRLYHYPLSRVSIP
nr:MAG TPA: hypothetical protein [Caudoviricetes sp.]DAM93127.1 MAG TPA: hypothetical protein [Caudoviricetes sp.]DAT28333.1 MAG TPA: hypothetical protein [Caudoviricetes sp.]